jgi:hypothetical protein
VLVEVHCGVAAPTASATAGCAARGCPSSRHQIVATVLAAGPERPMRQGARHPWLG